RPHSIDIQFAAATQLGSVRVVNPPHSRIGKLDVQVLSDGAWITVFSKTDLQDEAEVNAEWPEREASGLRLIIHSSYRDGNPSASDEIEEVIFPENKTSISAGRSK